MPDEVREGELVAEFCPECGSSLRARTEIPLKSDMASGSPPSVVWLVDCVGCRRSYHYEPAWETLWSA